MVKPARARALATAAAAATALISTSDVPACAQAFSPQHRGLSSGVSLCSQHGSPHVGLLNNTGAGVQGGASTVGRKLVVRGISSIDDVHSASSVPKADTAEEPILLEEENELMKQAEASTSKRKKTAKRREGLSSVASSISEKMGTVGDERVVFPEISTGEVPRLFSNLKYDRSEDGKISGSAHASGSAFGAACLIAGTTVGAGVLALPAATAPAGFLPSTAAMFFAWAYMTISGLLLSELSLNRMGETGKRDVDILDIYKSSLGNVLAGVGTAMYFFFHYALVVACIAWGGTNLGEFLDTFGLENIAAVPGLDQLLFGGVVGSALLFANSSAAKTINNLMLVGAGAAFLGAVGVGAGTADYAALFSLENQHPQQVVNALPIIFLSLGYQHVIPEVVTELEGDKKKITTSVVAGTAVPFLMFLAWNAVILGNTMGVTGVDPVAILQSEASPLLSTLVGGFSLLAVSTTLVGFTSSLSRSLADELQLPSKGPEFEKWKPALFAGALVPAIALSAYDPDIFHKALDFGGAFGISTLFLVLPSIMIWKSRYGEDEKPITVKPLVPGGKITLGSLWKAAGTLIVEQGAEKLGIIGFFHDKFLH